VAGRHAQGARVRLDAHAVLVLVQSRHACLEASVAVISG
jgi:hypothetical protein